MSLWPNNFYKPWEFLPWLGPWPVLDTKSIITGGDVCGVYVLINNVNGSMYVGQSIHIKERIVDHRARRKKASGCKTICLALRKYGLENFSFGILELCLESDLNASEKKWIKELKPRYNRNAGGDGNQRRITDAMRKHLSMKCRAAWYRKTDAEKEKVIRNQLCGPSHGHKVSDETREKLRLINIGKKASVETRLKMSESAKLARKRRKQNEHRTSREEGDGWIAAETTSICGQTERSNEGEGTSVYGEHHPGK